MGLWDSMEDEVESHQRAAAVEHPMVEPFFVDLVSNEEINPVILFETEAAEMNYFTGSSIAFTQPAISERYDCSTHFCSLNLDAMNEHVFHGQRAPDDDPTTEFEDGQEFHNKEAVLMAVKTYRMCLDDTCILSTEKEDMGDQTIVIRVLQGSVEQHFGYKASYKKHVTQLLGLLVILDKHKAIDDTINDDCSGWKPPLSFHAFYVRHIAANFMRLGVQIGMRIGRVKSSFGLDELSPCCKHMAQV
ncbi:hypothetical protein PIB30_055824 [Stylosanthes scabra]|uniref:Uncharacterized protein n=1 Tax=Stylosanthes scabra TaxID=79078 RepID=A0ABU6WHL3_9FABA|nr:hypothetical protein [Stylosanthes scabra]